MELSIEQEVAKAHLRAANWNVDVTEDVDVFSSHMIYIIDQRCGEQAVMFARQQDFDAIDFQGLADFDTLNQIAVYKADTFWTRDFTDEEDNRYRQVLVGLCKMSDTYRIWKTQAQPGERLHVIINFYEELDENDEALSSGCYIATLHSPDIVINKQTIIETAERLLSKSSYQE